MRASTLQKYQERRIPWLLAKAVSVFNAWIRERDREGNYFTCCSCHKRKRIKIVKGKSNFHAGHYYPAGKFSMLKFDEVNVNGECSYCNSFSGDHLIGYRETIIAKHGQKEMNRIETVAAYNKRAPKKWMRIELIDIIEKYSQ